MENGQGPIQIGGDLKSKFRFSPKLIFALLGLVLVIEIIFAVRTLTAPTPTSTPPPQQVTTKTEAKISLNSASKQYSVGDIVPVSVIVDTGGQKTIGVDAILRYDPKVLEASVSSIEKGTIYQDYPGLSVDPKKGTISISGIVLPGSQVASFEGVGVLATVNFKAIAAGNSEVNFDFQKGSTTDTNIVESASGQDILGEAEGINLTIR